jgi:hypothetical protein
LLLLSNKREFFKRSGSEVQERLTIIVVMARSVRLLCEGKKACCGEMPDTFSGLEEMAVVKFGLNKRPQRIHFPSGEELNKGDTASFLKIPSGQKLYIVPAGDDRESSASDASEPRRNRIPIWDASVEGLDWLPIVTLTNVKKRLADDPLDLTLSMKGKVLSDAAVSESLHEFRSLQSNIAMDASKSWHAPFVKKLVKNENPSFEFSPTDNHTEEFLSWMSMTSRMFSCPASQLTRCRDVLDKHFLLVAARRPNGDRAFKFFGYIVESGWLEQQSTMARHEVLKKGKLPLCLDLDHTLIMWGAKSWMHNKSCDAPPGFHWVPVPGVPGIWVKLRPRCKDFLERAIRHFELYLVTAGSESYAQDVLKKCGIKGFFPG